MIAIGNFLFRFRNQLFPAIIVVLYLLMPPPTFVFGSPALTLAKDTVAILVILAGLALRATAVGYKYIQRGGLKKKVYAKDLVTEGMFGVCRNPLYVGNMLLYCGVFLLHGNPLLVVVGVGLFAFMYQCIVYAEEAFLLRTFGEAYQAYCRDVPRWALRLRNFAASTDGMTFNVRRVIGKDYSTVSAAMLAVLATEMYKFASYEPAGRNTGVLVALGIAMALVGIATAVISYMKRRGAFRERMAS
ncbi:MULTISPECIES: isoprenylcysteine carboxylmethyltransferase family protein [unclassified Ensifer]|uniref:methyltransferase family protein n=1 Tax=unclassified Ensifer TaxID=2633371 RepID=UPI000812F9C3|nr:MULTISPECIES: isoprenylcysteine carboxylmethyltransferase family protein [unclassified Ensifer]OCP00602.1 phospholipid methyltransferase [Ensifer sp. LC14]OCP07843.1 phospholipid methyltransferase [Ensifer sp. LC11]OCP08612.1 phospholipid methyltransferase [Ensifer sp. LC13]OCP32096.1 phospholipid methyltransferase [Ensifer sp. LC499]